MAQPTNIFDSYSMVGIREDLADAVYNTTPEETPFFSSTAKTRATQSFHEWQTDTLRSSADNAHIEGDDTVASTRSPTTRLGNRCQIFKDAVAIPGSDRGTKKAGRDKEMAYQLVKVGKEQRLDIEKALFANQAAVAGSSTVARRLAGAPAWLTTNISMGTGAAANPTGDGTDARTDGTQTALTQDRFNTVMQSIWENAKVDPDCVYLSAFQMNVAQGFVGNNNQRAMIQAKGGEVYDFMDVYVTPWGKVKFEPTRENRSRDIFIMNKDYWSIALKRPTFSEALGKTGDNDKQQVITDLTLCCKNEAAHGGIFDNTTS